MEKAELSRCRLFLIGGSAGSLDVVLQVLPQLLRLPFPVVVVMHRRSAEDRVLEELLAVKSHLPLVEVEDKTPLLPGHLYVAPSDYHLLFEKNGVLALDSSEKVNYSRPSIDVSFESAAEAFGAEVVALLLSGANADGTEGLQAVSDKGGVTAVQHPDTAEIDLMPRHAMEHVKIDFVLKINEIADFIRSYA